MSRQGLKDDISRHNRFELLPVDLEEEENIPNDHLAASELLSQEVKNLMHDSNDPLGFASQGHAHTKALIHYDGERMTSKIYNTRVFINSKFKRRKHVDEIVTSVPAVRSNLSCRDSIPSVEKLITPSGHVLTTQTGLGGNAIFQIPTHTNVVDFTVSDAFITANDRAKMNEFFGQSTDAPTHTDVDVVGKRHYSVFTGYDDFGEYVEDDSNSDILNCFKSNTATFDFTDKGESHRVKVNRLRRVFRIHGEYHDFTSKPTVLYTPFLSQINRFLSSSCGVFFFYSNDSSQILQAVGLGLNVLIIHRHLYVELCNKVPNDIQVIIIMCRDNYFDVTPVKNRLIILNPLNVHPYKIMNVLFKTEPKQMRTPISLLASLKVKFGFDV